jgi:hypothetical protein
VEIDEELEPASPIAIRVGDPIVRTLKVAGPEPLGILRVLPVVFRRVARGSLAAPAKEPWERVEAMEPTARAHLAGATASGAAFGVPVIAQ